MANPNAKAVEDKKPKQRKPPGYRKFNKLLKQVVNSPPLPRKGKSVPSS